MAEQVKASDEAALAIVQGRLGPQEHDETLSKCKKILTIAQESGDKEGEMSAYIMLSEDHLSKEEYDDAIFYGEKCVALAQECTSKVSIKACITLGKAHLEKKEYDEAIFYSELCLAIAEQDGSREEEMNAYKMLGEACLKKKEYDDAIFYSEICLAVAEEYGDIDAGVKALEKLCEAKLYKREYDDAIFYAKKCLAMAKEWDSKDGELVAYLLIAQAHLAKGEHDDAIVYSEKCLAMAKELGTKEREINAYLFIAQAHLDKGAHDEAIVYWEKCIAMAKDSGDKEFEMYALGELAKAHLTKGEHEEGIVYGEKRLAMAKETGDKEGEMEACITIGLAHLRKGENDEAIVYGEKCAAIAQESDNSTYEICACTLSGVAHRNKGEHKKALHYDKKCIPLLVELYHDIDKEMAKQVEIILDHLRKEEYDDAILNAKKYLAVAQESGNKIGEVVAMLFLMNALLNKGEHADILFWLKKSVAFTQELVGDSNTLRGVKSTGIHGMLSYDLQNVNGKLCARTMDIFNNMDKLGAFSGCKESPLKKEDYDDVVSLVEHYLSFAQELGNKEAEMFMCLWLGSIHLNNDKSNDAYSYFKAGTKIAEQLENKHMVSMFRAYLCSIYESLGMNEELVIEYPEIAHSIAKQWENFQSYDAVGKPGLIDPYLSDLHERYCECILVTAHSNASCQGHCLPPYPLHWEFHKGPYLGLSSFPSTLMTCLSHLKKAKQISMRMTQQSGQVVIHVRRYNRIYKVH